MDNKITANIFTPQDFEHHIFGDFEQKQLKIMKYFLMLLNKLIFTCLGVKWTFIWHPLNHPPYPSSEALGRQTFCLKSLALYDRTHMDQV